MQRIIKANILRSVTSNLDRGLTSTPLHVNGGGLLDDFIKRKLVQQWTHDTLNEQEFLEKTRRSLKSQSIAAYCGFDPTAESLHLGNYITMLTLFRLNLLGLDALYLVGGATGLIGDPSGKSVERPQLDRNAVIQNSQKIQDLINTVKNNLQDFANTHHRKYGIDLTKQVANKNW
jgi:tyrosyl-tRNA synthetase